MKKILLIFVLVLVTGAMVLAQTVQIRGTVTSAEDGLGIPGVTISVKGTTMGTMTDGAGKYSINAPLDATTLVFTYVGMKKVETMIEGRQVIDLVMEPDLQLMDEVIVVGYGTQKKSDVTGSITQVKGDEIAGLATPSFDAQLAGRSAGVQITTQNGILGATPRMRIRGISSISSDTYPLVVVDGIPIFTGDLGGETSINALGDINPADIESMEILKDGSATAIYGSRAANGVILITTKKGGKELGRNNLTYSAYFGVASPVRLFDLMNAEEFIEIANEKLANAGRSPLAEVNSIHPSVDTDWQSEVLNSKAFQMDHNLAMSGGNEKLAYYFSLGYTSQEGVAKPNQMDRFTLRANVDQTITKWLKVGATVGATKTKYSGMNTGTNSLSGNIFNAIRQAPNTPVFDADTETGYNIDAENTNLVGRWNNGATIDDNLTNIVYIIDHNVYKSEITRILANAYGLVTFTPWLNYKFGINVDQAGTDGFLYWNPVHGDGASYGGIVEQTQDKSFRWNIQNILSFAKTFAADHNVSATLISEYESTLNNGFWADGLGLSSEFFNQNMISGTAATMETGGYMNDNGFISYAGRLNYNYAGKYFIQGSFRYDGISKLPMANKWGVFPGASVGWTVSKETFFEGLTSVVNDMKIRASYAKVGNTGIGNYPYLGLYGAAKYGDYNGIAYSQAGNSNLKWETSSKYDAGVDLQFLEGRFGLTFDWYLNKIEDMILDRPYPASLGIPGNSISENVGSMKNWGYEFSANAFAVRTKDLTWEIDVNLTLPSNEVTKLVGGQDMTQTYTIIREGEPIYSLYGYKYWGVNEANGFPVYYKADGTLVQLNAANSGVYVFNESNPSDLSTTSTLVSSDKMLIGNTLPTYFGGINSKLTYKNFDLNVMFRYSGGNKVMNRTKNDLWSMNFDNNSRDILNRWQSASEPGDGRVPRLYYYQGTFLLKTGDANTMFVENGGFVKVSNIQIGYNFPKSLVNRAGIENLRVYVQGQDMFIFTKYTGIDPEMESTGVDYNGSPRQKVITAGLTLTL